MFELGITSCREVDDELIDRVVASPESLSEAPPRQRVKALLTRMAELARPADGATRMLHVLARVAQSSWLEGSLEVRLESFGFATQLDVLMFDGVSFERIVGPLLLKAPFEEFVLAVAQDADALRPLELHWDDPGIELVLRGWEPPPDSMGGLTHRTAAMSMEKHPTIPMTDASLPDAAYPGDSDLPTDVPGEPLGSDSELPTEPKIPAAPRLNRP